ncbi:hypothetical protein BRD00_14820 [Halobacteriales archaeon QS_8_69_26]|nr:MAG: hypothetical protein BRD00_14820 [Halobacteriales archaeon QS_8_69_26]
MTPEELARECWDAIEELLPADPDDGGLRPPATREDLAALEGTLGVDLPPAFVEFYRIHDGQTGSRPILGRYELLPVERIEDEWRTTTDLHEAGEFDGGRTDSDPGIRDDWWNDRWVPFGVGGGDRLLCLDLAPAPEGHRGQVVAVEREAPTRELEAESFERWIRRYAGLDVEPSTDAGQLHSTLAGAPEDDGVADEDRAGPGPPVAVEDPSPDDLRDCFERHHERARQGGRWWLELRFEFAGEVGAHVRYGTGLFDLSGLVDGRAFGRTRAVLDDDGIPVLEQERTAMTANDPEMDADRGYRVTRRILENGYDADVDDLLEVRERERGR